MKCLKCGRDTDQTFCQECREEMTRYPVKPGTIVQLPKDRSSAYARHSTNWHAAISPEVQIAQQKLTIGRLSRTIAILLAVILLMGFAIFRLLREPTQPPVGQNYSTVTKPTETAEVDTIQAATEPTDGLEEE